jgi:uncharacterized membrane protein
MREPQNMSRPRWLLGVLVLLLVLLAQSAAGEWTKTPSQVSWKDIRLSRSPRARRSSLRRDLRCTPPFPTASRHLRRVPHPRVGARVLAQNRAVALSSG